MIKNGRQPTVNSDSDGCSGRATREIFDFKICNVILTYSKTIHVQDKILMSFCMLTDVLYFARKRTGVQLSIRMRIMTKPNLPQKQNKSGTYHNELYIKKH